MVIIHGLYIPEVLMVADVGYHMVFKAVTSEGTEGRKKVCGTVNGLGSWGELGYLAWLNL